ncbi:MAG: PHP domain-containing protein [Desulfosarcina sp.]|nr:PHP domain-containing protein [Desulfobacterales bacterium]
MDCNNGNIDLHIHSTASDGTLTPVEILAMARSLKLAAIAITDHDTIDGAKELLANGIPSDIQFLTGVEISASWPSNFPRTGSLHILGYGIKLNDHLLNQTLDALQKARKNRNPQIIKRLNSFGLDISMDDIIQEAGTDGQIGRPHIAQVMIKKGFAASINEVFEAYLGTGRPAYVDKYRVECSRAIEIICASGGIPVLAHPVLMQMESREHLEKFVVTLTEMGLKGIEVYYPEHTPENTAFYQTIAKKNGLMMTGGSDFHGSLKPTIKMGSGKGSLSVPYSLFEKLISAIQ